MELKKELKGKIGQIRKIVPPNAAKKIVGELMEKGNRVRRAKGSEIEGHG